MVQFVKQPRQKPMPSRREAPAPAASLYVLLVADDASRLAAWQCAIREVGSDFHIECYSGFGEAMLRSTRLGPHCLVVDAEEDSVQGAAVRRCLDRSAPQARILWVGGADDGGSPPSQREARRLQQRLSELARQLPRCAH